MFNRHRLKRKWGRGIEKVSNFLAQTKSHDRVLKDFAWHAIKQNPLSVGHQTKKRFKLLFTILIVSFLAVLMVGIYHPFFYVNKVVATGLQRISQKEFEEAILGIMDYRKLFFLPGNSYFLVDVEEIKNILKERFPIESVTVKKGFSATLSVQIEEKISTLIYDNGKEYGYLDGGGNIVEIIRQVGEDEWIKKTLTTTSTNEKGEVVEEIKILEAIHTPNTRQIVEEMGDYPILFDKRSQTIALNTSVISKEMAAGIIDWFNLLNKKTDISFGHAVIEDGRGEGEIITGAGWRLKVKLTENVDLQFVELQHLLVKEKINLNSLNYIDLRYPGRVYWQ